MVVRHNLMAMNSNRMLGITSNSQSKSTEKLSSGYKINRAADDAAGLSISEKMRKQIRGLSQATLNAQDGISAVQTAEGALNEVQDMLQRMNELAVKAANGTMSENDRKYIQDEVDQLVTEIDRVAETTKFNETYLLKGAEGTTTKKIAAQDAGFAGELKALEGQEGKYTFTLDKKLEAGATIEIAGKEYEIAGIEDKDLFYDAVPAAGKAPDNSTPLVIGDIIKKANGTEVIIDKNNMSTYQLAAGDTHISASTGKKTFVVTADFEATEQSAVEQEIMDIADGTEQEIKISKGAINGNTTVETWTLAAKTDEANKLITAEDLIKKLEHGMEVELDSGDKFTVIGAKTKDNQLTYNEAIEKIAEELKKANSIGADTEASVKANADGSFTITQATVNVKEALSFNLHVGADADTTNKIGLSIESMGAKGLGVTGLKVSDETTSTYAVDAIANAIQQVSTQRSALGAIQNRLEHTIANLDNVVENTTAAESQIRDTDMATEMVKHSNSNILAQAGQAMLAQANQANQGILSLLG